MNEQQWRNPPLDTIYLANGGTTEAHVNGKSLDGLSGFALTTQGQVKVAKDHTGEWREVVKRSHECLFYHSPKPLQDVLCKECATGSEPRNPKK